MSEKLESTLLNMVLSLVLISMVMSATLAFVYEKTKGPIEAASKQKEINSIKQVMPEFDNDPATAKTEKDGVVIYRLKKGNMLVGYAVKSYTEKGFGGHAEIMAGFLPDGKIYNIIILQHRETPGLGTKMAEPLFNRQFMGKNPATFKLKVKKDGGQVDAITAATVSSRAYCDALQRAFDNIKAFADSTSVQK
jgi:Na+-translocating ferredoxin:NAD+ oxidoreductase subunit G